MTYISRKTRLLVPHWFDECDPEYLYHLNKRRSDGRLKRHTSCDDLRAWVDDEYLNYQYLLELMTDGEFQDRPFLGIMGRFIPVESLLSFLCGDFVSDRDGMGGRGSMANKLNGKRSDGKDLDGRDLDGKVYAQYPRPSSMMLMEDFLRLMKAYLTKLENIDRVVGSNGGNGSNGSNGSIENGNDGCSGLDAWKALRPRGSQLAGDSRTSSAECRTESKTGGTSQSSTSIAANPKKEDFAEEYNKTLLKITCLEGRLNTIQQRREELDAKIESSRPRRGKSCSGSQVTELYSRDEQANLKRLQKKVEKLIVEKGQVLSEVCQSKKYLKDLKEKYNIDSRSSMVGGKRQRSSVSETSTLAIGNESQNEDGSTASNDPSKGCLPAEANRLSFSISRRSTRRESQSAEGKDSPGEATQSNSKKRKSSISQKSVAGTRNSYQRSDTGSEYYKNNRMTCRNCARSPTTTDETLYLNNLQDQEDTASTPATATSSRSLLQTDSQRTYDLANVNESIPDQKFKSETTMAEIEQSLRNYEDRLRDFDDIEARVELLKKGAVMASFFKKRWLKSYSKETTQKSAEADKAKMEIDQLKTENVELRKMLQRMNAKSEKEQGELQRLRYKQMRLEEAEREVKELMNKLTNYHVSYENQRECIGKLENTISLQRAEIEKLMCHMTRMCRITEKLKENGRSNKKNVQRSRSYGPDIKDGTTAAHGRSQCTGTSSDEEIMHSPCCYCCTVGGPPKVEVPNRPRSECGRRTSDAVCESIRHQQSCRRGSYYN